MAVLNPNEIFFTAFEPKQANRFILYMDGIPAYIIKGVSGMGFSQDEIVLNHINVYRKIKGKLRWNDLTLSLFDPRLHHESVTGRDGYSDFYKKDLTIDVLGPVGDIVSEWIVKGAFIKDASFGDFNWDEDTTALNIEMTIGMDYCVLNF